MTAPAATERLTGQIAARERALERFISAEAEHLVRACHEMARSFARGGELIALGAGPAATDAAHATVEFMHPVIVGKRALPALDLTNDPTGEARLARVARADGIALGLSHGAEGPAVAAFLAEARSRGMLTISMCGDGPGTGGSDYDFAVPSDDPRIVQEVHETAYHVLWELVHVFFEHPGLLDEACITCGDVAVEATVVALRNGNAVIERDGAREEVAAELVDGLEVGDRVLCHAGVALERLPGSPGSPATAAPDETAFLYPFLGRDPGDLESVLADARASTVRKAQDVTELRRAIDLDAVVACSGAIRERLRRGGRLIAFGNGGSATDAQDLAADILARGWPAVALGNDAATVTAVANDVGFDKTFARQLIAGARDGDVAVAISTSGSSANVIAGLDEAHRRGLLTCAIAGYDGGRCAGLEWLDHLFVVPSDYIPRIQEAQATIYHLLVEGIGERP